MEGHWEYDMLLGQNNDIFSINDYEILTSSSFINQLESMNFLGFPSLNDPNHALQRSDESIHADIESLLSTLPDESAYNCPNIVQEPSTSNFQNSMTTESSSTTGYDENEHTLFAYLLHSILTQDNVEVLHEKIMSLVDEIPEFEWTPKFIFNIWEAGYWIVKCADQMSIRWFIEKASELQILVGDVYTRLEVVSMKNLPTFKSEVFIKGQIVSDDKILSRFAKQNKEIELSTSRWSELKCTPNRIIGYTLSLQVDLLSFEKIKANGFKLFFGMETVEFKIHDKLEIATGDIISMEQGGMEY